MKKTGIELIAQERAEQIEKHGKSIEKDVEINKIGQLAAAAAVLSHPDLSSPRKRFGGMPASWDDSICLRMCSKAKIERLIIAGALIAAEIDRLQASSNSD